MPSAYRRILKFRACERKETTKYNTAGYTKTQNYNVVKSAVVPPTLRAGLLGMIKKR